MASGRRARMDLVLLDLCCDLVCLHQARDQAMAGMRLAGSQVGIDFDYSCYIDRQPVDSQRMLLYAARQGKQVLIESRSTSLNGSGSRL